VIPYPSRTIHIADGDGLRSTVELTGRRAGGARR
jgi:hypothetical protein